MIDVELLKEQGICPTCYNLEHGGVYEDEVLWCFLEEKPRSVGHTIILIKEHYNDMSYISDEICDYVFNFSKKIMNILKNVLDVERVYLCTMCDGKINHFHIQLIPRHRGEKIGSTNFVKERKSYVKNIQIINQLREKANT